MYKNKVSKYKNKLNQIGGAEERRCPYIVGDLVKIKNNRFDISDEIGRIINIIYSDRLNLCIKLQVQLNDGTIKLWNSTDVDKLDISILTRYPKDISDKILSSLDLFTLIKLYQNSNPETQRIIQECKDFDFFNEIFPSTITLQQFNIMFPFCKGIALAFNSSIRDEHFVYLRGIKRLNISGCNQITDDALIHLRGIHTLKMNYCKKITEEGLSHLRGIHTLSINECYEIYNIAYENLRGIHDLSMQKCSQITNTAFINLRGIHTLIMNECVRITNSAFVHLHGINTLQIRMCNITDSAIVHLQGIKSFNMEYCSQITDEAFKYLRDIHTLNMSYCTQITDEAFKYLSGIHTLFMIRCTQNTITDKAFKYLSGIHNLYMAECDPERIAYARSIGLPVTTIF